jgi:hypothetical protein
MVRPGFDSLNDLGGRMNSRKSGRGLPHYQTLRADGCLPILADGRELDRPALKFPRILILGGSFFPSNGPPASQPVHNQRFPPRKKSCSTYSHTPPMSHPPGYTRGRIS